MIKVKGDLIKLALKGKFDVIVHGCNCFCTMNRGIARSIRIEFPEALEADLKTEKGDRSKLGTFTYARVIRSIYKIGIINAYIQYDYRGEGVKVDYDSVRTVFRNLKHYFKYKRVGIPLIGAGLAGGNWDIISEIILKELDGVDLTLVRFYNDN